MNNKERDGQLVTHQNHSRQFSPLSLKLRLNTGATMGLAMVWVAVVISQRFNPRQLAAPSSTDSLILCSLTFSEGKIAMLVRNGLTFKLRSGIERTKGCFLVPVATGLALALCLLSLKQTRPEAKWVLQTKT